MINGNRILFDSINGLSNPRRTKIVSALIDRKTAYTITPRGGAGSTFASVLDHLPNREPDFNIKDVKKYFGVKVTFDYKVYQDGVNPKDPGMYLLTNLRFNQKPNPGLYLSNLKVNIKPTNPKPVFLTGIKFKKE